MKWKLELDALIESTMAFVNESKRGKPIADLPVAMGTAEQALADTSTPVPPPATITPTDSLALQRAEIRERVSSFKAHQERLAREREEYYLQMKARMLAPVDPYARLP
jgi:hypothetical protein